MKDTSMQCSTQASERVLIVGAGVSGLVLALLLSARGYRVSVCEKRLTLEERKNGRSINFTLSNRGLDVLDALGLKDTVIAHATILQGRIVHFEKKKSIHYKYGTKESHVLYSIPRWKLIKILFNAVNHETLVSIIFGSELINVDRSTLNCCFMNTGNKKTFSIVPDFIIGADGVFSTVRTIMLKQQLTNYNQRIFPWGYKEYQLNKNEVEKLNLKINYLHSWPRNNSLLIAIPNQDQSFSVLFFAPTIDKNGETNNFDNLIRQQHPQLSIVSTLIANTSEKEHSNYLVKVEIDKWYLDDKIVLVGDACHATYPFYGQGMNAALDDAIILNDCLSNYPRKLAFSVYESNRKKDTDALHVLSEAHFYHLMKFMTSSSQRSEDFLDFYLARLFPHRWKYEYEMVAHSKISYLEIINILKHQKKIKYFSGIFLISFIIDRIFQLFKIKANFKRH